VDKKSRLEAYTYSILSYILRQEEDYTENTVILFTFRHREMLFMKDIIQDRL